jgi:outer membrane immunogenic protein
MLRRARCFFVLMVVTLPQCAHADWNQIYLSAGVGADALTDDGRIAPPNKNGHVSYGGPVGADVGWDLSAGIDTELNQMFVVGAFADLDWSNIDTKGMFHSDSTTVHVNAFDINNAWTVGGRAGVLVTPSTLAYGLLGYSWFDFNNLSMVAVDRSGSRDGSNSGGGFSGTLNEPTRSGITVGGGLEQKITPNVSLKAEYRFTDLGDAHQTISTLQIDHHTYVQMVRVGAAYRLGWGPANAEGSEEKTQVTKNWTGFYGGAGIGVDAFVQDASLHALNDSGSIHVSGLGGGDISGTVTGGYDQQIAERWLVGPFADFDWMGQAFKVRLAGIGNNGSGQASGHLMSLDNDWTVGARGGYLLANDVLAYGLLGFTRAEISNASVRVESRRFSINYPSFDGVTVGGGFEKRLTDQISLRAEYRFTDLQDGTIHGNLGATVVGNADPEIHSASIIAAYRFH